MTLGQILAAVYQDLNLNPTPAAGVDARIRRYVNEGVRVILREPGLTRLADSDTPLTVTSVPQQARYTLAESVARIHAITDRTNDRHLHALSLGQYRHQAPDPASVSGIPEAYVPIGLVAVATQPIPGVALYVVSTSASDTTQTAYVEGLAGEGRQQGSVLLTGTTEAIVVTGVSSHWSSVEDFYLSAPAVGAVSLHEHTPSHGAQFARITIGQTRPHYFGLYLWPTPAGAVSYTVDYRRTLTDLVNDTDEPPLPEEFHTLLVAYARLREYEKTDDSRIAIAQQEFGRGLARLKYATQTGPDELPVMGSGARIGRSRLGPWYPADHWS